MSTIFEKDKDAIVSALRECSQQRPTCLGCPYSGRCYDLHPDAANLAYNLCKALDYIPSDLMLNTLKRCDTCSKNGSGADGCIYHKINGPKACDEIQSNMADYIEELYSKFLEKNPPILNVSKRPFYANINGTMEEISDILPHDVEPIDILDATTYMTKFLHETEEEKNMGPSNSSSFIMSVLGLAPSNEQNKKYIPKSIEQSADHKTVVVIWNDGTKTIVRLSANDPDDIYMAFTAALAKKIFGSNSKIKKVISTHLNEHKPKKKHEEEA